MFNKPHVILVIDDDPTIRDIIVQTITQLDHKIKCFEAENGISALKNLKVIWNEFSRDPDLIILDLEMPIMDGWDFIKAMKKDCKAKGEKYGIPIIVLSCSSGEDGVFLNKKSVHNNKTGYFPLITIAKDTCLKPEKYDTSQSKGLKAWVEYFLTEHHFL